MNSPILKARIPKQLADIISATAAKNMMTVSDLFRVAICHFLGIPGYEVRMGHPKKLEKPTTTLKEETDEKPV